MSSNPSTLYQMDIFSHVFIVSIVMFVLKDNSKWPIFFKKDIKIRFQRPASCDWFQDTTVLKISGKPSPATTPRATATTSTCEALLRRTSWRRSKPLPRGGACRKCPSNKSGMAKVGGSEAWSGNYKMNIQVGCGVLCDGKSFKIPSSSIFPYSFSWPIVDGAREH